MDVKGTSGRQGHDLKSFFLIFWHTNSFHIIRSSDPTSFPCIGELHESYSSHYQLGHLLTPESDTIRHIHMYCIHIFSLCFSVCLAEDKERRKRILYAAFGFLMVVYFTRYVCIYYTPTRKRMYAITSKAWVCP
jgi:hypothetical protein